MEIKFYPDSDLQDVRRGVEEYKNIWSTDGDRIIEAWERHSGLKFRETFINALVFDGVSSSFPLRLRHDYELNQKRISLVHELGHRILFGQVPGIEKLPRTVAGHYLLFLLLGDILEELYGKKTVEQAVAFDKNLSGYQSSPYAEAWDWALGFTAEERKERFKEILKGKVELFGLQASE